MKRHNLVGFIKGMLFMQLFLVILFAGMTGDFDPGTLPEPDFTAWLMPLARLQLDEGEAARLMAWSNSSLAASAPIEGSWLTYWSRRVPEDMMAGNLRVLASRGATPDLARENQEMEPLEPATIPVPVDSSGKYAEVLKNHTVVVYCTHSAETYIPDSGQARVDGSRGLVNGVAQTLAEKLGEQGAKTEYIDTMHDCPDYNQSYARSRQTVKAVVESQKDLLALFDIHRDSIPGQKAGETIIINGRPCARILIILGSDERKPHPHWRENQAFAEKLCAAGEEMYPGLLKGIKIKAGTYNQEFFPQALLLEFGSDQNSFAEAQYAAELFAEVVARVLGGEEDK